MTSPYRVVPLLRYAFVVPAMFWMACVGGKLTPAAESGILATEFSACEALSAATLPAASVACAGSEELLKAALDRVTAASPLATAASSLVTKSAVTRTIGGKRRVCGYVPATIAPAVQAQLDAQADAGADGGGS